MLNLTPTTTISHGVLAAKHGQAATSRTASLLSYAILLGGFLTFAVAFYVVVISYSSLPFWDGWIQVEVAADGGRPLSPAWLWQQHNEHRLVIPKLLLAADLRLFQARQVFLLASILTIQLLHWGLLSWSMWVLGGWRGALWRAGAGLAAFCLFCPAQWQNFVWGFQVCFVLPQFLATASFVALLLYWTESQQKPDKRPPWMFLVVSLLAALGATYSLASGNLLWPLLVAAGAYLRLRIRAVLSFAITGTLSTALYLHHYVRPPEHGDPIAALGKPLVLLKYCVRYLFGSWSHRDIGTWEVGALVAFAMVVALLVPALRYTSAFRPFAIQLVFALLFCAGTALITAAGRSSFGIEQARASRYQSVALLFWCCLGLLWLGTTFFAHPRMRYAFLVAQICTLLVFARGAALVGYPIIEARQHAFMQNVVTAVLISGVHDPEMLSKGASPDVDMVLRTLPYLQANRLSVFSGTVSSELGKPLTSVFPLAAAGECVGLLTAGTPLDEPSGPGLRLAGWVWDTKHHQPPSAIVVTTNGRITGLGTAGGWVSEGRAKYPELGSSYIVFFAVVPKPQPGAVVDLYAILRGNPSSACYFDGWRQIVSAKRLSENNR